MINERVPLFVIKIPDNSRSDKLINTLSTSKVFDVRIFPAVMYQPEMREYRINFEFQKVLYGKILSNGEIGCAISHREVQKILANSTLGGVILEDDARISDLSKFEEVVWEFLKTEDKNFSVLSLLPWNHRVQQLDPIDAGFGFYKLFGQTPLNVGYALTRNAALDIAAGNSESAFLPDWPPNRSVFFTTINGVALHGDANTASVLDLYGRNKLPRRHGLRKFLIYPYFANRRFFSKLSQYLKIMILPSITWRIDNARFSVKQKISKPRLFR